MHQLLDLLTGHLSTASQFAQHPLAIGAGLVDHLAALLLGHLQLRLGVGAGILTTTGRLDLGFLAQALRLVGGFAQHTRCAIFGAHLDLVRCLACGGENANSFLTQHACDKFFVQCDTGAGSVALRRAQLTLKELFALLQPRQFGCHHPQELAYFLGLVPAAGSGEVGRRHCRRRRGVGT